MTRLSNRDSVTVPMSTPIKNLFAPTHVRGDDANPVFRELAIQTEAPSWNFNKYVVDSTGKVVMHFDSSTSPDSPALKKAIESVL